MALPTPIPRLPGKQRADRTYILGKKVDVCWADIARLDGNVWNVARLLNLSLQTRLLRPICREL